MLTDHRVGGINIAPLRVSISRDSSPFHISDRSMATATQLLSTSFTPIVLISACGLITPSLYSRLGELLSRIRLVHHQKIELLKNLHEHEFDEQQMLMDMLDSQSEQITDKARMVKNGLNSLLTAIAAFLFCSVLTGAEELNDWIATAALGMWILGVLLFIVGLSWAMWELSLSLEPLEAEKQHLKVVTEIYLAKSRCARTRKVAESVRAA